MKHKKPHRQCIFGQRTCVHEAEFKLILITGVEVQVCKPHENSFSIVTVLKKRIVILIAALLLGFGPVAGQCWRLTIV